MKAITIHQPWATLIALEQKKFETRSWKIAYRGELAIHAGKKIDKKVCRLEPFRSVLAKHGYNEDNLPTGAIVAVCRLEECWSVSRSSETEILLSNDRPDISKETSIGKQEEIFGDYSDGRYAWELSHVQRLPEPVPATGRQGLWTWEALI